MNIQGPSPAYEAIERSWNGKRHGGDPVSVVCWQPLRNQTFDRSASAMSF